MLHVGEKFLT